MYFSDDPCIQELRTRSKIHLFYPRRQRHTVLERMVRNSCYRQLRWDMSSSRHVALRDSTNARFLPLIAKLHQVLFALCNLQSFYMLDKCLWIHTAYASLSLLHLNIPMSHLKKMSSKGHIALEDSTACLYLILHLSYQPQKLWLVMISPMCVSVCVCVCVCVCVFYHDKMWSWRHLLYFCLWIDFCQCHRIKTSQYTVMKVTSVSR